MKARKWVPYVIAYLFLEGLCYVCLLLLEHTFNVPYDPIVSALSENQKVSLQEFLRRKQGERVAQDPILGWVHITEANSAGMRDDQEYARVPRSNSIRVSAFGNSFTYAEDVELGDTWAKQLNVMDNSVEVLNYGVPAYGLDQAYLRYLKIGTEYNPNIVFIGYMSENIARNVNVFRSFYTRWYRNVIFSKPRFKVSDSQLVLLKNPLSTFEDYEHFLVNDRKVLAKLGEDDYHYQINYHRGAFDFFPTVRFAKIFWYVLNRTVFNPIFKLDGMYSEKSEAYEVTIRIFDAFYRKVLENGALPIILIFPDTHDQRRIRKNKKRRYSPLLDYFRAEGYNFIDTLEALELHQSSYTIDDFTENWGHYSPLGNRIIAEYIYKHLKNWDFTNKAKLKTIIQVQAKHSKVSADQ